MKKLLILLIVSLLCYSAAFADVVLFDDDIIKGQIQNASITTDAAYEGSSSIFFTTTSTGYSNFNLDIQGSVEIGSRKYLSMWVNFAADSPNAKLRRMQITSSNGTSYLFDPAAGAQFYVDGEPAVVVGSRIQFNEDPYTWQLLSLDITQLPGPMDTTMLRLVSVIFMNPVDCYIDDIRVTSEPVATGVQEVVIFDDDIVQGQIQGGSITTDTSFEGDASIFYTTQSTGYTTLGFDITGSVEIGIRRYLNMWVNFAEGSPNAKIRRMQVYSSNGTLYTYDPTTGAQYYVDGQPAVVSGSRIQFDDNPDTWQLLTLDLFSLPGPMDTTKLRIARVVFQDPVDCYIDDVTVTAEPIPIKFPDVVLFDDDIVKGQIQYGSITTDTSYEGDASIFYTTESTGYTVLGLDIIGSIEIGDRRYLNMWVNFAEGSPNAKIRRMQVYSSNGTLYTYDPTTGAQYYVDGREAIVSGSRIQFDNDPNTWQLLTLDMASTPGPMDTTLLRIARVVFMDPVDAYIDMVFVSEEIPDIETIIKPPTVLFDDALIQGQLAQYRGEIVTDMSYEGNKSIYLRGFSGFYEYIDVDLQTPLDIYGQRYIKMYVNFAPDTSAPDTLLRRIQLVNTAGTFTYGPELVAIPTYYIDGKPVLSAHSRLVFNDDPQIWQQLTIDLSTWSGWDEAQNITKLRIMTYDDVHLYVDYITAESSLNPPMPDGSAGIEDLKVLVSNWLIDCNAIILPLQCE